LSSEDVVGGDKFYCPFKDCSALLINDTPVEIRETECPHCHRLFCASCRVPGHSGIKCEEFKKLGDDENGQDDLKLRKLAKDRKWQRCPKCQMYVETGEDRRLRVHCLQVLTLSLLAVPTSSCTVNNSNNGIPFSNF
jgi:hypothetical protein